MAAKRRAFYVYQGGHGSGRLPQVAGPFYTLATAKKKAISLSRRFAGEGPFLVYERRGESETRKGIVYSGRWERG